MCGISLSPTINKDRGWEKRDKERNKSGKDKRGGRSERGGGNWSWISGRGDDAQIAGGELH